jgi:deferrochelatase/peroxidase EfeB
VARLAALASFTVVASSREDLAAMFSELSLTVADLMAGRMPEERDPAYPPAETGVLGGEIRPDHLGIVVSVGAGLFDDRFGLADRKPSQLVEMPFLSNDRLDPDRSHGDLLVTIEADHDDTIQHSLRQIMRATRAHLVLRWTIDGYARGVGPVEQETPRNLMGFKDGTANLDITDDALMDQHVWVGPDDGEPAWAVGGSYHVVRVIRMFVEFWDRTRLEEQEAIMGRHKVSGAPLGEEDEFSEISYEDDPGGEEIPLDAHIRLANPRTPATEGDLMLRRGFSFARGVDDVGQLDQGLAFVSYQRELDRFLRVQARLDGEPLEEYILPVGGGFFFALPGAEDDQTSLAAGLLSD